jgi:O-antigen/teichoic acid export membrane protein
MNKIMFFLTKSKQFFLKRKLIKETTWAFLAKGVTFILYFALNIILARKLGPEKLGLWSLFYSVFTIYVTITSLGINSSTKKFVAQYREKGFHLKSILSSSTKINFLLSLIFSLLFIFLAKPISSLLNQPELQNILVFAPLLVFSYSWIPYLKAVFTGLHRIKFDFIVNMFEHSLNLIFALIFLRISGSVISALNAFTASSIISAIAGLFILYQVFYNKLPEIKKSFAKEILKYSLPFVLIHVSYLALTQSDTIMLGMLSTKEQVGFFSVANQISSKFSHISLAIAMGTMPIFANENADLSKLKATFKKLLRINSYIFIPICIIFLLTAQFFVPLIFSPEYSQSALILKLLVPFILISSYLILLSSFLDYRGLAKKRAFYLSISALINIFLNYFLIPQIGASGAAIATSTAYIPYIIFNGLEVKREFRVSNKSSLN